MIKKVFHWECICEKCGNSWVTRTDQLPVACPGCKSRAWNPGQEKVDPVQQRTEVRPAPPEIVEYEDLEEYGEEWDPRMWSPEKEEEDRAAGEYVIYRQRLVKPFDRIVIRREH